MINSFKYESFKDFRNLREEDVKRIEKWFEDYKIHRNLNLMEEKIILIMGENNQLKTSLAQFICEHYNLSTRLLNIQDSKINKDIREFILQISNNKNVLNMIYKKNDDIGIIIDDFDTLCNNTDKSIITEFLTLFNTKKKGGNEFKLLYPIILVCQETGDKKINDLRKIACEINLDKLCEEDYGFYLEKICSFNKINLTVKQRKYLLSRLDYDLRKYNHVLEDIKLISGVVIKDEDIDFVINTFSNKSCDDKINENLETIFTKNLTVRECIDKYYSDKFLFSFLIHEHYLYNIGGTKVKNEDKLRFLSEISKNLADNDVVQNLIFEKQLWDLNINSALLTNANTNFLHREIMNANKNPKIEFHKRKYTTLLNKVSLYFTNRKVINRILHKYGNNNGDAFYFSEFLCDSLKRIEKKNLEEDMEKYIMPILKEMDMTSEDVDLILRLNKLEEDDIKKVYTTKYKNYVKGN